MKIAIHDEEGKNSDYWIAYCQENDIGYKIVDCYTSDIIAELSDCDGLMWHWSHTNQSASLFARQLIQSVQSAGKAVFPAAQDIWHYDDKLGQKYLLEAHGLPLVPSHAFFNKDNALAFVEQADFPLVFKLRGGAGSINVRLVSTREDARRIVNKSFGSGWSSQHRIHRLKDGIWRFRRQRSLSSITEILRGVCRAILPHQSYRGMQRQRGYAYFQDFIPENETDIRVNVIGDRAFAFQRGIRRGDFRASGSGLINYDSSAVPIAAIQTAFRAARALKSRCLAFDFVMHQGEPLIVEISYTFVAKATYPCEGYWDQNLNFVREAVIPEKFMIEDFVATCKAQRHDTD